MKRNPDTFQLVQQSLAMPATLPFVRLNKIITEKTNPDSSMQTQTVFIVTCRLVS